MFWLIQNNLKRDDGIENVIQYLKDSNKQFQLVKAIPFTDIVINGDLAFTDVSDEEDYSSYLTIPDVRNIVTIGSYSLARSAIKRGWTPGAFINANYEFSKWKEGWGAENLLNGNAIEAKIEDIVIPKEMTKVFARPSEDTKYFAGQVFERDNFCFWLEEVKKISDPETLSPETSIIVSNVVDIDCEFRLFIIDGEIVTGSLYKTKNQVIYSPYIDKEALDYAKEMLKIWQPDRAFVLDIALTPKGPKIIEINNINSSGFYASDIPKIIESIDSMKF